jgi:hypothetical protein
MEQMAMKKSGNIENRYNKRGKKERNFIYSINPLLPFFIGCGIIIVNLILNGKNYENNYFYQGMIIFISFSLICFSGILTIIRKESPRPGLTSIKGFGAIIIGGIIVIFSGGIIFYTLYELIKIVIR